MASFRQAFSLLGIHIVDAYFVNFVDCATAISTICPMHRASRLYRSVSCGCLPWIATTLSLRLANTVSISDSNSILIILRIRTYNICVTLVKLTVTPFLADGHTLPYWLNLKSFERHLKCHCGAEPQKRERHSKVIAKSLLAHFAGQDGTLRSLFPLFEIDFQAIS